MNHEVKSPWANASILLAAALAIVLGCTSPSGPTSQAVQGDWYSQQLHLALDLEGGVLTYQCGSGTIDAGWRLNPDGSFSGTGRHTAGGGPVPSEALPSYPAQYHGYVERGRFIFGVTLVEVETTIGPYLLTRNEVAVGPMCL